MEKRINGHTRLYALIGSPVGHSGSPAMQNYSFEKLGIDGFDKMRNRCIVPLFF